MSCIAWVSLKSRVKVIKHTGGAAGSDENEVWKDRVVTEN